MKRKLGLFYESLPGVTGVEAVKLLHDAGFDCYCTGCCNPEYLQPVVDAGNELGMTCEFIHAPFGGNEINNMWLPGLSYLNIFNGMKKAIDTAAACKVPVVVAHISHGWYPPEVNDLGLARFDELVLYAAERDVKLAFENVYSVGNLAYFADRYEKLPNVGLCYDAGHEHCFTKTVSWLDIYTEKVFAIHINDNPGRPGGKEGNTDMHWLPFKGDVDYEDMMKKLNKYGYEGSLILEVSKSSKSELTHEEWLADCYERAKKISEMGQE